MKINIDLNKVSFAWNPRWAHLGVTFFPRQMFWFCLHRWCYLRITKKMLRPGTKSLHQPAHGQIPETEIGHGHRCLRPQWFFNAPIGDANVIATWSPKPLEGLTICRYNSKGSSIVLVDTTTLSIGPHGIRNSEQKIPWHKGYICAMKKCIPYSCERPQCRS